MWDVCSKSFSYTILVFIILPSLNPQPVICSTSNILIFTTITKNVPTFIDYTHPQETNSELSSADRESAVQYELVDCNSISLRPVTILGSHKLKRDRLNPALHPALFRPTLRLTPSPSRSLTFFSPQNFQSLSTTLSLSGRPGLHRPSQIEP